MNIKKDYKSQLLSSIPVVAAMDIDILAIENLSITLSAPLSPNINYEGTAFGGSLNTLCILSGYLLVHHILKSHEVNFESLVIQDSSIKYRAPVKENFFANAVIETGALKRFLSMMEKKGRGRAEVSSQVFTNGRAGLVDFRARFVVH